MSLLERWIAISKQLGDDARLTYYIPDEDFEALWLEMAAGARFRYAEPDMPGYSINIRQITIRRVSTYKGRRAYEERQPYKQIGMGLAMHLMLERARRAR